MESAFERLRRLALPHKRPAVTVGAIYLVFGMLWIAVSDELVAAVAPDPATLNLLQTYKGWAFVLVSAVLITFLVGRFAAQRDELERARAHDEAHYRRLIDNAQEGFWQIDTAARTVKVNRVMAGLLGYTRKEMLGKTPYDFVDEENRRIFAAQIARAPTNIERSYEITLRDRAGQPVPALFHANTLRDESGHWQGSYAFVTDVRELKATEDALRRANRAHRTLSGSNRALIHGIHEGDLPRQICQVAVEQGGYAAAWAGLLEGEALRSAGHYGLETAEAGRIEQALGDREGLSSATTDRGPAIYRRDEASTQGQPGCPVPIDERFEAALVLPVRADTAVMGLLVLFSAELDAFSETELELLNELAMDLGFGIDTLRRRARERENLRELKLAGTVFENAAEGILVTDPEERIIRVNRAFTRITGYQPDEAIGETPQNLLRSGHHDPSFYQKIWAAVAQWGHWEGEIWNRRKNGEIYPEWLSLNALYDEQGKLNHYVRVFSDVSRLKESEEELDFLAHFDALTRAPNRTLFAERLRHAVEHAEREGHRLAVLCFDLDAFKQVNDGLGHGAGDQLLQDVVARLQGVIRQEDTLARLGGDDFALLLEAVESDHIPTQVAHKIQQAFTAPFSINGQTLRMTVSIGVAVFPEDGTDPTALLQRADTAMHWSKQEGRGGFRFYSEHLTALASDRLLLENDLHDAIEQEQFRIVYQPQVELASGRVIGLEALARWDHPEQGRIGPERFIPVAEETGLIIPLGEWILETACAQAGAWLESGRHVGQISVNVSGIQMRRSDLKQTVSRVLERTRLPAAVLEVELTEKVIMEEADWVLDTLAAFREKGVGIAVDDFGTGYSSLGYLRRLPVTKLKIDKTFVDDVPGDANAEAIVRAVIALGHALQLRVVAEGVETREQADFLLAEGCHEGQGYLYSRPVEADEAERMLAFRQD